jgi:hypothetical protein
MPEIRALSLYYFNTEIPKGNKEMVVRAFAVLMEKSPSVVTVMSAAHVAPQAVTEADSDEDAEDDNNTSQVVVEFEGNSHSYSLCARPPALSTEIRSEVFCPLS